MCDKNMSVNNAMEQDYLIEVSETLSRTYVVRAVSLDKAHAKVHSAYKEERIILSGDDCVKSNVVASPYATSKGLLPNDVDVDECGYYRLEE